MHWFHDPSLPAALSESYRGVLIGSEAAHALQALRVRGGERVVLTDGKGRAATCTVVASEKQSLSYVVESVQQPPKPEPEIWLVQALAKGGRDELAIQTATELGATGIIGWQAERSVVRWDETKRAKGLSRWNQICIEAAKQSQRAHFPEVFPELALGLPHHLPGLTLVLEPTGSQKVSEVDLLGQNRINLIVGPEGGFENRELEGAAKNGYHLARLGSEILRTSSAGPAAIAAIQTLLGRW